MVDLFAGFEIQGASFAKTDATIERLESQMINTVTACICTEDTHECYEEDTPLEQNEAFSLCIRATTSDVIVKAVNMLSLQQDGVVKFIPVTSSGPAALTALTYESGYAVVRTMILAAFFAESSPSDITAFGLVELEFVSSVESQRKLRDKGPFSELTDEKGFEITLTLSDVPSSEVAILRSKGVRVKHNHYLFLFVPITLCILWV